MKSPFPGMDPFIEGSGLWGDFHHRLIVEITNSLSDSAPARYLVRIAEREYLELIETEGKGTKRGQSGLSLMWSLLTLNVERKQEAGMEWRWLNRTRRMRKRR